jgi:hypothetical protein
MTRPGEIDATGEAYRPLVSRSGLLGLSAAVVVVLSMLLPSAVRRQTIALEILPDALSLIYLDLDLSRRPDDAELRLQVARKSVEAGQFGAARHIVAPLLTPGSRVFERSKALHLYPLAEELRLEIDRKAWAAIEPSQVVARDHALKRVVTDIDAMDLANAPAERVQKIAELCQSLAQPARAAELLDRLAQRKLPEFEPHLEAAETAHLQADQAGRAVALQVFAAESTELPMRLTHALRALELARAVKKPEELSAFAEDLRARFGQDAPQLIAASLDLAQAVDAKLGYQLAQKLLRTRPDDAALHRRLAKLAEWNGNSLKAMDEYVWLVRHEGRADDRDRAIELAKANWDLRLLRTLLAGAGSAKATASAAESVTADPEAPVKRVRAAAQAKRAPKSRAARQRRRARQAGELSSLAPPHRAYPSRLARTCGGRPARDAAAPQTQAPRQLERLRAQLRETIALDEALGDTRAALSTVDAALRGALGRDASTLEIKVALLLRSGMTELAADAQTELTSLFPSQARAVVLADLRLGLGQTQSALRALTSAPGPLSDTFLRQVYDVAWEAGDLDVCERTARELVALPTASSWDVARLYQLQRENADPKVPFATAKAGFDRFKNAEMLRLVIESAARADDDSRVAGLLRDAEQFGRFRGDPGYWQQRITLHQRLAFAAFEHREFVAAKRELGEAEKALARAPELAPSANDIYDLLWTSQHAQALAVALEANDKGSLARVFEKYGTELPIRQRVYVLHRLDRNDEAYALAQQGATDPRLSNDDRAALAADRPTSLAPTSTDRTDYARASSDLFDSEGLRLWTNQAELELDGSAFGLKATAALTEITPQKGLRLLQPTAAREVQAELGGRILSTELSGGFRVRDGGTARPFGVWRQALLGDRGSFLSATASVHTLTFDSAQLRLAGATDEVAIQSSVPFGLGYYATARAAGNRYVTLERDYLGAGLSFDAGAGRSFTLPSDIGRAAVRIAGRYAPRFRDADREAREDARLPEAWIPATTAFTGVGASLARGELEVPNAHDPRFRFLLDGTIGVLWPDQSLGWSGQVGVGSSVFGSDQLSASLHTGNVVGSVAYWSVQAGYAVGLE